MMKHRSSRQILVLVLGVFLALGMSVSAVQAAKNAFQMATTADDAGTSGPGNCNGCGGGDSGKGMATCAPVLNCGSMAAVLPMESALATVRPADLFNPVSNVARSLTATPDPYPPRPHDLV